MAQVMLTGKTIHLYLPVERLFTADLDDIRVTYLSLGAFEIKNPFVVWTAKIISAPQDFYWEVLARLYHFAPLRMMKFNWVKTRFEKKKIEKIQDAISLHPEVQDEIGQMLFAVARVARSTDLKLDFYSAQITDTRSGHEFILEGYLQDMSRLQLMDISQKEYHLRMLKDTRVNNRALVHYPVRGFFLDLNQKTREEISDKYFAKATSKDWIGRFYFRDSKKQLTDVSQITWEVEDVRSFLSPGGGRALVYVKVEMVPRNSPENRQVDAEEREFIFETLIRGKKVQILRVMPFELLSKMIGNVAEFKMDEKTIRENIKTWHSEFEPKEILMEDFLARQMVMRLYDDVYQDERIANTFNKLHYEIRFRDKPKREFVFEIQAELKDQKPVVALLKHEDMVYLEEKMVGLAATVFHSYQYRDFDAAAIELPEQGERMTAPPANLELYHAKKKKFLDIFTEETMSSRAVA